jgi:glycosyltransferase involved in cell wall biosynthesis
MHKICSSLANAGYEVKLIGRLRKHSIDFNPSIFSTFRIQCWFDKGKLFYIEYNLRLFFYLLQTPFDIVCAIDLDTIAACYGAGKIKAKFIVFDAHEYFPEVPELLYRPLIKKIWSKVEQFFVPRINYLYTVSEGLSHIFKEKYKVEFAVIRNISILQDLPLRESTEKYILYQGMLNKGRGLEQLIEAMPAIDSKLYMVGDGDIANILKEKVKELKLENKVKFLGLLKPDGLRKISANAHLGINLLENKGLSYYYSLSNKFFDYIHAAIPQIAMSLPEYKKLNDQYQIALLIDNLEQTTIQEAITQLLHNNNLHQKLKQNTLKAREELCWQNEEKKLLAIYNAIN